MTIGPMAPNLFAILGQSNLEKIAESLKEKFPDEHYPLANGQWLLSAHGKTTREIAEVLQISPPPPAVSAASAVIVGFTNYYGRANPQIWEWIAARMKA